MRHVLEHETDLIPLVLAQVLETAHSYDRLSSQQHSVLKSLEIFHALVITWDVRELLELCYSLAGHIRTQIFNWERFISLWVTCRFSEVT